MIAGASMAKGTKQSPLYGSKSKAERVDRSLRRREQMYRLMAEHPESAEELSARVKRASQSAPMVDSKMPRAMRKAERSAADKIHAAIRQGEIERDEDAEGRPAPIDPGTPQTVIKLRKRPLPKLVDDGKIGQIELQSAEDILTAFSALASGLMSRGINYDRVDNGRGINAAWPTRVAKAVVRYQDFAGIWTARNNDYGDPTLSILIGAIVDQHWIKTLANDNCCRVEKAERAIIGGLRDYAARAGFVTGTQAQKWQDEAAAVFGAAWLAAGAVHQGPAEYRKAVKRAAVER